MRYNVRDSKGRFTKMSSIIASIEAKPENSVYCKMLQEMFAEKNSERLEQKKSRRTIMELLTSLHHRIFDSLLNMFK